MSRRKNSMADRDSIARGQRTRTKTGQKSKAAGAPKRPDTMTRETCQQIAMLLYPDQHEALRKRAFEENTKMAKIIRDLIDAHLYPSQDTAAAMVNELLEDLDPDD